MSHPVFTAHLRLRLDQIPQEAITVFDLKDGSGQGAELNVMVSTLRKPDKFGNELTVYLHRSPKEIADGKPAEYCGRGRFTFSESGGKGYKVIVKKEKQTDPDDIPF